MTGYVVDASVAVKCLVTEAFSDQAASLLSSKQTLLAPELLFAEAANALWAMCRRGDITKADFAEAVDVLKAAPLAIPFSMNNLTASAVVLLSIWTIRSMTASIWPSPCRNNIRLSQPIGDFTAPCTHIPIFRTG